MDKPVQFSWKKRGKSFKYAFSGIIQMFHSQHNAWIHGSIAVTVIVAAILLNISATDWCLIIFAIGLVLIAEIINSSIEKLVDIISPEYNIEAGKVKDMAAGGALIAAIVSASIGCIVFIPEIIKCF